jgi:hypothetical protein
MRKILVYAFTACAVVPLIVLPYVIAQARIRGHDQWDAIFLALGMTLPIVVISLIGYIIVRERIQ